MYRRFNAKVLLFGEYTLLVGSSGLTIPLKAFSGKLSKVRNTNSVKQFKSNQRLKEYLDYLTKNKETSHILDIEQIHKDVDDGLYFDSDIPQNYGVGSSGALVAALYDRYNISSSTDFSDIREEMSFLEVYFHGQSSGIDPLSIFLGRPLLVRNKKQLTIIGNAELQLPFGHLYILDSGITAGTHNLVRTFFGKMADAKYKEKVEQQLVTLTEKLISSLIDPVDNDFPELFKSVSELQLQLFEYLIPDPIRGVWENSLSNSNYLLKLCGSGGGGYILLYAKSRQHVMNELPAFNLIEIL